MTEAVKLVTLVNIIFIILLLASSSVAGYLGEVLYYFAFAAPIFIGFYASGTLKKKREEIKGVAEPEEKYTSFSGKKALDILPLIVPTVTVVFCISYLTSLLLSLAGIQGATVENQGIFKMLLIHALVPAFLEEALFRYIAMRILLPYSKRWCIIYSAICFSLIHCDFTKMPYAFVAGVVFMAVDIAFESVWPSVILHLCNNAASVLWIKYCASTTACVIFFSVLVLFSTVSVAFIIVKRRKYRDLLRGLFDRGEGFAVSYAPALLIFISCCIAALSL